MGEVMEQIFKTHKDLDVWKLGIELVTHVYKIAEAFPKQENYGLSSQMRRCAISIPSNIAEGAARKSRNEYIHFLYISLGSLSELETQLIIAQNLGYLNSTNLLKKIEILRRMKLNLIKYLKNKSK